MPATSFRSPPFRHLRLCSCPLPGGIWGVASPVSAFQAPLFNPAHQRCSITNKLPGVVVSPAELGAFKQRLWEWVGVRQLSWMASKTLSHPLILAWPWNSWKPLEGSARKLEWSDQLGLLMQGSSQPRDWTQVSCISGRFFTSLATYNIKQKLGKSYPCLGPNQKVDF